MYSIILHLQIIQCIAKGAGLSPYHPVEYKSRKNSFRSDSVILSGHDTPNAFPPSTKKFPQPTGKTRSEDKKSPTVADDNEILEVRSDGMRETNLFTFSFYAPWIKISQMNASKKEANDFRLKVGKHCHHLLLFLSFVCLFVLTYFFYGFITLN